MKKLMIFLMIAIPLALIVLVNLTVDSVSSLSTVPVDSIELHETNISGLVGETYSIPATISPANATNKKLKWESTDENVVKVDDEGNITLIGLGTAYITAYTQNGGKSSQCYFYVTDTTVHEVNLVADDEREFLNIDEKVVALGNKIQLRAVVIPYEALNKSVMYTSFNPEIASIDCNGLITTKSTGFVTFCVNTLEGEQNAYFTLKVINPIISLSLDEEVVIVESYYTLKPKILPLDAIDPKIVYSLDNNEIASVDEAGNVIFNQVGTVIATLESFYDKNIKTTCKITYTNGYAHDLKIDLNQVEVTIGDDPIYIQKQVIPSNTKVYIEYDTSNNNIAYVDYAGFINFVGGGNTIITVKIKKSANIYIEKTIAVSVKVPAEDILLDSNVVTADTYQIIANSIPSNSTNYDFFFHSNNESIATVSQTGEVRFLTTSPSTVLIDVYANYDNSNVKRTVTIEYTAGYAKSFTLIDKIIKIKYGERASIQYNVFPVNTSFREACYEIISQIGADGGHNVIEVLSDGTVTALGGGTAQVAVKLKLVDDTWQQTICSIEVQKFIENIEFNLELNQDSNGIYVTSINTLTFDYMVLPLDSTNKNININIDSPIAFISGNNITFNSIGIINVSISSMDLNFTKTIKIWYVGPNAQDCDIFGVKTIMYLGESFTITTSNPFPDNALYTNLTISVINQQTQNPNGQVFEIHNNTITAIAGGKATLVVKVSPNIQKEYFIESISLPTSVSISPKNIVTFNEKVTLYSTVLPIDTTNGKVKYIVNDESIAFIEDDVLTFSKDGIVEIYAICLADETVLSEMITIEKRQPIGEDILVQNVVILNPLDFLSNEYCTAISEIDFNLEVKPAEASNKNVQISIVAVYPANGIVDFVTLEDRKLKFNAAGLVVIHIKSEDKNFNGYYNIRYTAGKAKSVELNVSQELILYEGEEYDIEVNQWFPNDTLIKDISLTETSCVQGLGKVIQINNNRITALSTGISKVSINISQSITQTLTVRVVKLVEELIFEDNIITSKNSYDIIVNVYPVNATNKTLDFTLIENGESIAVIQGNKVIFNSPGTVTIKITTKDGSDIEEFLTIKSTMGFLDAISLTYISREIYKGTHFYLLIKSFSPADITDFQINYEIISSSVNGSVVKDVISIDQNGKVLGLYGGRAIVRVSSSNNEIYADCEIEVITPVSYITIESDLDIINNEIKTARDEVNFVYNVFPIDASITGFSVKIDDDGVAFFSEGKLVFNKEGTVLITFTSLDTDNGEKSRSVSVQFTNGKLISAILNRGNIDPTFNLIKLKVDNYITFSLEYYMPINVYYILFGIENKIETPNDGVSRVIDFYDNKIVALNGGEAKFSLSINNLYLGEFTIIVIKDVESIDIDNELFTSTGYIKLNPIIKPFDASFKNIQFTSLNESIARVDADGYITFLSQDSVKIRVSAGEFFELYKDVTVTYSNRVQHIEFLPSKTTLACGENLQLSYEWFPIGCTPFEVEFSTSNGDIATVNSSGKVFASYTNCGEVTISLHVKELNIQTSRTFTVINYITNISLELDASFDSTRSLSGENGYRVFGNEFFLDESTDILINTYQMEILSITSRDYELKWESSNTNIATVDSTGKVTFSNNNFGKVTITVSPLLQYNNDKPISDSYTFTVVDAVNVFNTFQFNISSELEKNIALHANIPKDIYGFYQINGNIYGNSYMVRVYGFLGIFCEKDNISIDNIHFKGVNFKTNPSLVDFENAGALLTFINSKNCIVRNSILENKKSIIEIYSSQVTIEGCIIRNAFSTSLLISRMEDEDSSNVTVRNCIFGRSLMGAILFDNDKSKVTGPNYINELHLENTVRFYNWNKIDDFQGGIFDEYSNFRGQIIDLVNEQKNIAYNYNGKDYYMLGIVHYGVSGLGVNNKSNGITDSSKLSLPITPVEIKANLYSYALSFKIYTYFASYALITPADNYEDNKTILNSILQRGSV